MGSSRFDERQVGQRLSQRGWHGDDSHVEVCNCVEIVGDQVTTRRQCTSKYRTVHVFHERLALRQSTHPSSIQIEPDDAVTNLNGPHGQRKAHVPLPHHQNSEGGRTESRRIGCIDVHN